MLKLCDVFVTASTSETQGLTVIEAMAGGIPVPVVTKMEDEFKLTKEALLEKQDWLKTELIKIQHYLRQFKPNKNELDPDIGYYSCLIKELLAFLKTHRNNVQT